MQAVIRSTQEFERPNLRRFSIFAIFSRRERRSDVRSFADRVAMAEEARMNTFAHPGNIANPAR
jgi:hypothetical protein